MQRYSFATLVTAEANVPSATHLPFIIEENDDEIILSSHFSRANPQATRLEEKELLVIFSEPHAYVSPSLYEKTENVPTWNYLAVHAYGKAKILSAEEEVVALLERSIVAFEPEYLKQWQQLSQEYKSKMVKGIVAFQIGVTSVEGKKKLSQNKTKAEQHRIIEAFDHSQDPKAQQIAEYMKLNLNE